MQTPTIAPIPWDGSEHTRPDEIEPGIYLDPFDLIRHCPGISYSKLKKIMPPNTPAHLHDELVHPERYVKPPEEMMDLVRGRMLHCLMFEPEKFKERFFEPPADFTRRSNENKAKWEQWVNQYGAENIIHSKEQRRLAREVKDIVADLLSRRYTREALSGGYPEVAVFWRDAETGAKCKGKLDYLKFLPNQNLALISDLKSTNKNHDREEVKRSIGQLKYDIQAGFYMDGVHQACGWESKYMLVYQRVKPPWFPQEYELGSEVLDRARDSYRQAISILLECYAKNEWPSYSDRPIMIDELTPWDRKNRVGGER